MLVRTLLTRSTLSALCLLAACGGGARESAARPTQRSAVGIVHPTASEVAAPVDAPTEPPSCADLDEAAAWLGIPAAERAGLDAAERTTADVELDGVPPAELAIAVNLVRGYGDGPSKSLLWVLRCSAGAWTVVGRRDWEISEAWDGFYDDAPGVRVLRAESVTDAPRTFLRVEMLDQQGGVDPRYSRREFSLLDLTSEGLVTAFSCVTHEETVAGPNRDTVFQRLRVVTYQPHATIRVRVSGAADGRPSRHIASADYVFDGSEFHAGRDVCRE